MNVDEKKHLFPPLKHGVFGDERSTLDISHVVGSSPVHALFLPSIYHTVLKFDLQKKQRKLQIALSQDT